MNNAPGNKYIGYISRTRGLKGELQFYFEIPNYEDIDWEFIFIEIDKKLVPFFINSIDLQKNKTAFVFLDDVDDIHKAEIFVRKNIFLPEEKIPKKDEDEFDWDDFIGFTVIEAKHKTLGKIIAVEEMPQQHMITVDMAGKDLLFPFSEDWVQQIDIDQQNMYVELPEGLVELYRNMP